jgi:hypothetical protein
MERIHKISVILGLFLIVGTSAIAATHQIAAGSMFTGLIGGVLFPIGAILNWLYMRRLARTDPVRAVDHCLPIIWGSMYILALASGA